MKWTKTMAVVMFFLVCIAVPVMAQSKDIEIKAPMTTSVTGEIRLRIPFDFVAGGTEFKEGTYFITPMNDRTLVIKSADLSKSVAFITISVSTISDSTGPKLIFHRYGDRTFLAQTWNSYSESGRQLLVSSEEIRMARLFTQQQIALLMK